MAEKSLPFDWVPELREDLLRHDSIPLLGGSPKFPWKNVESKLAQALEIKNLEIIPSDMQWRSGEDLYTGLSDELDPTHVAVSTMTGSACWLISETDKKKIIAAFLSDGDPTIALDPELSEGFYRFFCARCMSIIDEIGLPEALSVQVLSSVDLPKESGLCMDITVHLNEERILGRLVLSPEFRKSWADHFAPKRSRKLSKEMAQNIPLSVALESGYFVLSEEEWDTLNPGDFIPLKRCAIDPDKMKGRVNLTVDEHPVFVGKLRSDGTVKILGYPAKEEVTHE
ncbi:MAG: hypothetical protein CMO81_12240 [Waddliaceae bacterium]|nr:hypothetical protein [Waddliaceae bacterium]